MPLPQDWRRRLDQVVGPVAPIRGVVDVPSREKAEGVMSESNVRVETAAGTLLSFNKADAERYVKANAGSKIIGTRAQRLEQPLSAAELAMMEEREAEEAPRVADAQGARIAELEAELEEVRKADKGSDALKKAREELKAANAAVGEKDARILKARIAELETEVGALTGGAGEGAK